MVAWQDPFRMSEEKVRGCLGPHLVFRMPFWPKCHFSPLSNLLGSVWSVGSPKFWQFRAKPPLLECSSKHYDRLFWDIRASLEVLIRGLWWYTYDKRRIYQRGHGKDSRLVKTGQSQHNWRIMWLEAPHHRKYKLQDKYILNTTMGPITPNPHQTAFLKAKAWLQLESLRRHG